MYYNLLISGDEDAWLGEAFIIDKDRCINSKEYTKEHIANKFATLTEYKINELKQLPCIFAYENHFKKNPKLGFITEIICRQNRVKIEYKFIDITNFINHEDFLNYSFDLDIGDWEYNRTHWAIKEVDLYSFLKKINIQMLPTIKNDIAIDISKHNFEVAVTFPGEVRTDIESIVNGLSDRIGKSAIFYDNFYKSQLARPSLDLLLQDIYRNKSNLIVVFLCEKYQEKEWCNLEFRAVRDIIKARQHEKIMFIKMDDGAVDGVFSTDGYIDARHHNTEDLIRFIEERISILKLS